LSDPLCTAITEAFKCADHEISYVEDYLNPKEFALSYTYNGIMNRRKK